MKLWNTDDDDWDELDALVSLSGAFAPVQDTANGARALMHLLETAARGAVLRVLGDSTSNGPAEWFALLAGWLASVFPAYTVLHRSWDDTNQGYDRPVYLQTGTAAYVNLPGAAGDRASVADSAAVSLTGDTSHVVVFEHADWRPGALGVLASKYGSAGNRSYRWYLNTSGTLTYEWSADGTTLISKNSTAAVPSGAGKIAVAVSHDVDNGAAGNDVKFWTAPVVDGTIGSWTQLGATVTTAGTTSIFDSTNAVEYGCRAATGDPLAGKLYYAEIRSGTGLDSSPVVASLIPGFYESAVKPISTPEGLAFTVGGAATIVGSPALLADNASTGGKALAYSADPTRLALQTPTEAVVTFVSYSHNEGGGTTLAYGTSMAAFVDQHQTRWPLGGLALCTQNTEKSPAAAATILNHAIRNDRIAQVAAVKRVMLVDAFKAFTLAADPNLIEDSDGVHPTAAGTALWLAEVQAPFLPWVT